MVSAAFKHTALYNLAWKGTGFLKPRRQTLTSNQGQVRLLAELEANCEINLWLSRILLGWEWRQCLYVFFFNGDNINSMSLGKKI